MYLPGRSVTHLSRWSRSLEDAALWRSWEEDIHHLWPTNIFASGAVAGISENKKRGRYLFSQVIKKLLYSVIFNYPCILGFLKKAIFKGTYYPISIMECQKDFEHHSGGHESYTPQN